MNFKLLTEKINQYDTIIIHGHVSPDGDCYGSQFGLREIILQNFKNKTVYIVGQLAQYVAFLGEMDTISDDVYKDALCIAVDTGNSERVSDQRFFTGKERIKLDHHVAIDPYGDINIVDEESPACALIVLRYAIDQNLVVSPKAATALYTATVTDTGRFRHGITEETFVLAGKLLSYGADAKYVDVNLSIESLNSLKLKGYVLSNFVVTDEGLAYVKIPLSVIKEFNVSQEEASNQVGVISSIETCPVWALFIEGEENVRGRLRSRGPELDKLANQFNGGGHKMASGVKFNNWDEVPTIIVELNKLVKEYKAK